MAWNKIVYKLVIFSGNLIDLKLEITHFDYKSDKYALQDIYFLQWISLFLIFIVAFLYPSDHTNIRKDIRERETVCIDALVMF